MTIILPPPPEKKKTNKITEKNKVLESARKLSDARDKIIILFEKDFFRILIKHLKQKKNKNQKKNQKKTNFLNTLRMNQKVLTMNCSKNIFMLQHLLFWHKNYSKQKIKIKTMTL